VNIVQIRPPGNNGVVRDNAQKKNEEYMFATFFTDIKVFAILIFFVFQTNKFEGKKKNKTLLHNFI
jgi:hypothetical protein